MIEAILTFLGNMAAAFKTWADQRAIRKAEEAKAADQLHAAVKDLPADELPKGYEEEAKGKATP